MKVCRELGGPLMNAGLGAAVVQLTQGKRAASGACFKCGKVGHLKRQCPERKGTSQGHDGQHLTQPDLCPRCKKGKHWANECRSVKDINGQPLSQTPASSCSKNGRRAHPQGLQIYGAVESQSEDTCQGTWPSLQHPRDHGEPLRARQNWTSMPPPDSY